MSVAVTEIGWDGSMRRRALDTSGTDTGGWENLIEQVLAFPPPYRAAPCSSVYVIHAADRAVLVGEQDLTGPLRDLVTTILAGGTSIAAQEVGCWAATGTASKWHAGPVRYSCWREWSLHGRDSPPTSTTGSPAPTARPRSGPFP